MRVSLFLLILLSTSIAYAELDIFTAKDAQNKHVFCSHNSVTGQINSGRIKPNGNFIAYTDLASAQKRKLRRLRLQRASTELITKTKRKIFKLTQLEQNQTSVCEDAYNSIQDPLPEPSPSPAPSAPPQCNGNFDDQGNACPGKFEIPLNLQGNITRGSQIQQLRCGGCHIERTNYQYQAVWTAIHTVPDMNGVLNGYEKEQAIADLVAYFNRFS